MSGRVPLSPLVRALAESDSHLRIKTSATAGRSVAPREDPEPKPQSFGALEGCEELYEQLNCQALDSFEGLSSFDSILGSNWRELNASVRHIGQH